MLLSVGLDANTVIVLGVKGIYSAKTSKCLDVCLLVALYKKIKPKRYLDYKIVHRCDANIVIAIGMNGSLLLQRL